MFTKKNCFNSNVQGISLKLNDGYIYVCYSHGEINVERNTDVKIQSEEWDCKKTEVLCKEVEVSMKQKSRICNILHLMEDVVNGFPNDGSQNEIVYIRSVFDSRKKDFLDFESANAFWDKVACFVRRKLIFASDQVKTKIEVWLSSLLQFEDLYVDFQWSSSNLTAYRVSEYRKFLEQEKGVRNISVVHIMEVFRRFVTEEYSNSDEDLFACCESGCITPTPITKDELWHLILKPLDEDLDNVRIVFCMMCLTGMELRDLKLVSPLDYLCGSPFEYYRYWTRVKASVPMDGPLKALLHRLLDIEVKQTEQYYNNEIKRLFAKLGFNREVILNSHVRGSVISESRKLSEVVTLASGRETFIQNTINLGLPMSEKKLLCGVKSDEYFEAYDFPVAS